MAEPFSVGAAAASVVDLAIKVVRFINETRKGAETIDEDLRQLVAEVEKLRNVSELIRKAFEEDTKASHSRAKKDSDTTNSIWLAASSALVDCKAILIQLNAVLDQVRGEGGSTTFERVRRHFRKLSRDDDISQFQQRLDTGHQVLQMSLIALNILTTRQAQIGNSQSFTNLSSKMATWETKLEQLILSLESTMVNSANTAHEHKGIATARSVQKLAWLNVHFMVPQPVSNMFMGREPDLARLEQELQEFKKGRGTKRVVLHGIGGSGKTQLSCKFAQDNRSSFWGVFFVDATNPETIQSSYADIARRAGIEPNAGNVKYWLSEQTRPWLFIVDNADYHLRSQTPEAFIPESECGIVLFTTRNHLMKTLGDITIKLAGLGEERSSALLLTSAGRPQPFETSVVQTATEICRNLGFLPLPILHAGRAILRGTCNLDDCLDFVARSLTRVKRIIQDVRPNFGEAATLGDDPLRPIDETVYATFEMVIPAAREEALQILQMLSFMQSQRFQFQILLQAIVSPQRQSQADKMPKQKGSANNLQRRSMSRVLYDFTRQAYTFLEQLGERPTLPTVLLSLRNAEPQDAKHILRTILSELSSLAVIDHIEADDTWSMHSSVRWWIRASMSYQENAVWCQAASNVLTSAILLPPVGVRQDDEKLRRLALPHIESVRKREKELLGELRMRQARRDRSWPSVAPIVGKAQILRDAKFGLVYAESGMWEEARQLMSGVDAFLVGAIGLDDPVAIRVRLFLSETYWWLGEADEAVRLQQDLLNTCKTYLGDEHLDTLKVKVKLGSSLWQQGRFYQARDLAQQSVAGYHKAYPSGHVDKFVAMSNLGRCLGKLADFDGAVKLHSDALEGLVKEWPKMDPEFGDDILFIMDNLAMARHDRYRYGKADAKDLDEAARMEEIVLKTHSGKLGKQHPKSLWATSNLARIKASMGELEEAEKMMKAGLSVAKRTLGPDHIGTLMGMTYLGQILTLAGKLPEAEGVLCSVVDEYRIRDGQEMHPDHLVAAALLLDCYRQLQKYRTADAIEVVVLKGIKDMFGEGSAWQTFFVDTYTRTTQDSTLLYQ